MALIAIQLGMAAVQWKGVMIERREQVMAGQAIGAILRHVTIDKSRIDLAMARFTLRRLELVTGRRTIVQ